MFRDHLEAVSAVSVNMILSATLILAGIGCSDEPEIVRSNDEILGVLPGLVEQQMQDWHVPGLAIGIVKDGEVIFAQGFGYRDREEQLPVTTKTMFPIASCSKAFTAMSAAIAADEGILDLDRPIKEFVPDFQLSDEAATDAATLRDFLQHRSGLDGFRFMPEISGADREEVFRRLRYFEPTNELGEKFRYSNLGYTVAGHIVEKASGMTWEEYVSARIFEPLGMTSACFTLEEMTRTENFAVPYLNILQDVPERWPAKINTAMAPAGGIVANLEDMLVWLKFNLAGGMLGDRQMVSSQGIRAMQTSHADTYPDSDDGVFTNQGYGLGWNIEEYRDYLHIYHGGLYDGYISWVDFLPDEDIGVVVLTNMYYHHLHSNLAYQVFDQFLGLAEVDHHAREIKSCGAAFAGWREGHDAFWGNADPDRGPTHDRREYSGLYSNPLYGQVTVDLDETGPALTFAGGIVLTLRHYGGETFSTVSADVSYDQQILSFESNDDDKVIAFTVPLDGHEARFER